MKPLMIIEAVIPMDIDEVWPDGAPDNPTVEDAQNRVDQYIALHGMATFLSQWNLLHDITVTMDDRG